MTPHSLEEARFYFDQDMVEPDVVPLACGVACVFSARCPGKETPNEDAAAVIPFGDDAAVVVVADGLGGSAAGEQASRLAVQALRTAIDEVRGTDTLLRTAIITGFDRANAAVQDLGIGAATTLAAVKVSEGTVRPFHVGDSAILLIGGRGRLKFQTIAHSPVGYGVEAGLLDENEAMSHEDRHVVSNVIGAPDMRIEIGPPIQLKPRDTLFVASDGLSDNLELAEILAGAGSRPISTMTRFLVARAAQRMVDPEQTRPSKPDDLTLIAFRLSD